ncbi:MAG: hypothetical protein RBT04_10585 [Sphaerochaetaceae bacterium]|jgi:hypothetical protein|nr:hypothetical protein [Sphaerochaetaceae bacterium]
MMSNNYFSARAHWGEIIGVNADTYTVDVKFTGGRVARNISWLSPYSFLNGNGMYIMPQVNASVMLLEYAPACLIIIGFWPLREIESTNRTGFRRKLGLGDVCIQGSDQCYILMRRSSEHIILQTGPKCNVIMKNSDNSMHFNLQRLKIETDSGIMSWDSNPETLDTTFTCMFKDKADEQLTTAFLTIGFHKVEDSEAAQAGIDKSIISLIVYETETSDDNLATTTPKFKLIIGSNGRIICSAESLMEIYRDFIDRYADTYMKDIARQNINRESLEENISDKAKKIARTDAEFIHHNKGD